MPTSPSNGKIRVLQLIDGFTMGGGERIVFMLSKYLNPQFFDVIPCALHRLGPLENELKAAGLDYHLIGIARRSVLTGPLCLADSQRILRALTELMTRLSVDIIHTHLNESTLFGILAARRVGQTAVCTTIHNVVLGTNRGRFSPREWLMQASINSLFARADRVIGVSDEVTQTLQRSTRLPSERLVTIPNGIDGSQFQLDQDKMALRQQLGLPLERPIAISVGRLTRQKGYPDLLTALTLIPAAERPMTLIVGDGPDRHALEELVAELGLTDDVRFLGGRSDIPDLLVAADCFVLASLWEGLPLVLIESMAARLPAIVTSVGGNPGVVEDGETGLLVPASDPPALAKALRDLLGDRPRLERIGMAARVRFQRDFSLDPFIRAHEELYREVLAERSAMSLS